MQHKKVGFKGQRMVVLPRSVKEEVRKSPLISRLRITDIGYYPQAKHHLRERKKGTSGHILMYCVDGFGWYEAQGVRKEIERQTVCIIPAGIPHRYGSDPDKPWTIYWMHIEGEQARLLTGDVPRTIEMGNEAPEVYFQRIRLFDEIFSHMAMTYNQKNIEYACLMLGSFLASLFYQEQYNSNAGVKGDNLISRSMDFMGEHLSTNLNLKDFAVQAGLSVSQYSNVFKKYASTSPMNFYAQLKVQKSCQLMENPKKRIKEIALELGFDDQFYFTRVFTRIMGMSPARFRKSMRG
jgi:AraC family transcriptional regulator, arabinose operon regulatory protein